MAAIILAIVILAAMVLGLISIAISLYREMEKDIEFWEKLHGLK